MIIDCGRNIIYVKDSLEGIKDEVGDAKKGTKATGSSSKVI